MGLGFMNGPACMISTHRLKKGLNEQLFKTVVHELGHNFGMQHCPVKICYTRDAESQNPIDEAIEFCSACRNKLINEGWIF
jgi:archaemetzincin